MSDIPITPTMTDLRHTNFLAPPRHPRRREHRTTVHLMPLDPELRRKLTRTSQAAVKNVKERDQLIAAAYRAGATMREIARAVDMTHPGVRNILIRDGIYDPSRGDS